jgi:hypothetical protein
MANPLLADDIVSVKVWCTSQEQASVNTFFYEVETVVTGGTTDQNLANAFDLLMGPAIIATLATTSAYNGTEVQIIRRAVVGDLLAPVASTNEAGAGTVTGNELPRQTCGITGWYTNYAGRGFRGRTYWPFPPVSFDSGTGVPSSAAISLYTGLANIAFNFGRSGSTGVILAQQLYRRPRPKKIPPILSQATATTFFLVRPKWATQRRRGSFGRANVSPI